MSTDEVNGRMMNPLIKCLLGCGMDCTRFNWIVVAVLFVHAYIYGTVVSCVIIPWFENSVPGVMNLAFLTVNTTMSLICYVLCVVTDAGRVPEDWKPDEEENQLVTQVKKKGGGARFCQKCNLPKPARCHHCRVCKKCVLRMDHHCPWVNNCIGHRNYKSFFLLLIYITAAALHALGLLALYALNNIQQAAKKNRAARLAGHLRFAERGLRVGASASGTFGIAQAVCFCITLPIAVGLLMLLGWHVYLILCNKTTIEYHEGVTAKVQARKSGQRYQHPYHIGPCGNLHAVLGANILGWLWPLPAGAEGPGTTYPVGIDPF